MDSVTMHYAMYDLGPIAQSKLATPVEGKLRMTGPPVNRDFSIIFYQRFLAHRFRPARVIIYLFMLLLT